MQLWHEDLIPFLPRQQLLGQHRECCALRGKGWGRKHKTVDYVFTHSPIKLFQYHELVMEEMEKRGYHVDPLWWNPEYRGKQMDPYKGITRSEPSRPIYSEHDEGYKRECLENLKEKGIVL